MKVCNISKTKNARITVKKKHNTAKTFLAFTTSLRCNVEIISGPSMIGFDFLVFTIRKIKFPLFIYQLEKSLKSNIKYEITRRSTSVSTP